MFDPLAVLWHRDLDRELYRYEAWTGVSSGDTQYL